MAPMEARGRGPTPLGAIAKGIVAGAAGTAVLTGYAGLERAIGRGRGRRALLP